MRNFIRRIIKEETKKLLSESHKEAYRTGKRKPSHLGKYPSEETKRRISEAKRGTKRSPEAIEKTRQANIGRKQTDYQKQKAREANEKTWKVITPEGTEEIITNLRQYALERSLDPGNMMHVARGRQKQHKGYKVLKLC
mgnify:CR=1 FL=1